MNNISLISTFNCNSALEYMLMNKSTEIASFVNNDILHSVDVIKQSVKFPD